MSKIFVIFSLKKFFEYRIRRWLVPLNERHFAKLGGGTRQRFFVFLPNLHVKKLIINKILFNQILKFVMTILKIIHTYLSDGNQFQNYINL